MISQEDIDHAIEVRTPAEVIAPIPRKYQFFFRKRRYKVVYGGRGGAKSWTIARILILLAHGISGQCPWWNGCLRIGCFRELQSSIRDSVHRLLVDQINLLGLSHWFIVTRDSIIAKATGSEFIFKGLKHNVTEIKSLEGIDIAWVEEAHLVSKESWDILIPTIRRENSEIWASYNPRDEKDETHQRFVINPLPLDMAEVVKVNWYDNPWFPGVLDQERRAMLSVDQDAYAHVWEGECRTISEAVIFKGRYVIEAFEKPEGVEWRHGNDFGYANDPNALMRFYITSEEVPDTMLANGIMVPTTKTVEDLWIESEIFGYGVETDDLPKLLKGEYSPVHAEMIQINGRATTLDWPIYADGSRPETISYLSRQGFSISAAEKWPGSVEDGITHLKMFRKIHIHDRCKEMQREARMYSWKLDKDEKTVLPVIVDKHNHGWDAIRYGLEGFIQKRGGTGIWAKLGR